MLLSSQHHAEHMCDPAPVYRWGRALPGASRRLCLAQLQGQTSGENSYWLACSSVIWQLLLSHVQDQHLLPSLLLAQLAAASMLWTVGAWRGAERCHKPIASWGLHTCTGKR